MTDEALQCGNCGHTFRVSEGGAARVTRCPVCDTDVVRPGGTGADEDGPKLRVRRNLSVDGVSPLCPSCRAMLSPEDLVCGACGMVVADDADAMPLPRPARRPRRGGTRRAWNVWGSALFLLAGIAIGFAASHWKAARAPRAAADPEPTAGVPADPAARLPEMRARIREVLDAAEPLAEAGSMIEIERLTGQVLRGRLASRDADRLLLVTEAGPERIAFDRLRPRSRLRVDPAFRERQVEQASRRGLGLPDDNVPE